MTKRIGVLILVVLASFPIVYVAARKLRSRRPGIASACPGWVLQDRHDTQKVQAAKVVVEPLQGRHNVYGIFKIPEGYAPSPFFVVQVPGSHPYCGTVVTAKEENRDQIPQNDQTFVGRFRTRTTLWLMTKGQADDLNHSENWSLAIVKRSGQSGRVVSSEEWKKLSNLPAHPNSTPTPQQL